MVVEYLKTIKTLTIKKLRRIDKNSKYFFVKFQASFLRRLLIYTFIHWIVWLWWPPNDIYFNNLYPQWKTISFVETTKLFISNSVRVYRYICEIFYLYVPGVGLLTPCFVPRGKFLYIMIVTGGGFLAPLRVVFLGGGMVLDETDSCISDK